MDIVSCQHRHYFGPDAHKSTPRLKNVRGKTVPDYRSTAAKDAAEAGKFALANWLDDYNSLTFNESHACAKIRGANDQVDVGPKKGIGLPPHLAGRQFKTEDGWISGDEYCKLMGYKQTERGKRRHA